MADPVVTSGSVTFSHAYEKWKRADLIKEIRSKEKLIEEVRLAFGDVPGFIIYGPPRTLAQRVGDLRREIIHLQAGEKAADKWAERLLELAFIENGNAQSGVLPRWKNPAEPESVVHQVYKQVNLAPNPTYD